MHIPDGFVSPEVALACAVPAAVAVGYGVKRAAELDERRAPLLAATAAFVFAAHMLNFPVAGGTSGHFLGAALAALLLGPWVGCAVLAVVLGVQAVVFGDGGLLALGANVLNMGVLGALTAAAVVGLAGRGPVAVAGAAWLAGMAGAAATAAELAASGTVALGTVLPAMLEVHAVIGIGEAAITVAVVGAVFATRPELRPAPAR